MPCSYCLDRNYEQLSQKNYQCQAPSCNCESDMLGMFISRDISFGEINYGSAPQTGANMASSINTFILTLIQSIKLI